MQKIKSFLKTDYAPILFVVMIVLMLFGVSFYVVKIVRPHATQVTIVGTNYVTVTNYVTFTNQVVETKHGTGYFVLHGQGELYHKTFE